jgi:hypothetical protein
MRQGHWLEVCGYVVGAALAFIASVVQGAQYFVAPGGANSNPGTSALPWATLQHAADVVHAGDFVDVRPGDYIGFYLETSGTTASRITFFAEPGVLINQRNATTPDGINLEGASYVTIDGFGVADMPRAGVRTVGDSDDMAEFVTIRNVHAYDNQRWGIFTGHVNDLLIENNETSGSIDEHGIYVSNSGDRPVIRNNYSWGNHGSGIHMNGDLSQEGDGLISNALISGNRIYNNGVGGGSGINMDGVQNSRIENNLIWNNHASGISLYKDDGAAGSSGNLVINNTIDQPDDGRWALNIQNASINNTVRNNILISEHASRGAIDISSDSLPGLMSDYNAAISRFHVGAASALYSLAQWRTVTGQDPHSFATNAASLFVNAPGGDYHLKPGSPAIDAGTSLQAPAADLFGTTRVGPPDIGAIEFSGISADFNGDGTVNGPDLTAWRTAFAAASSAADADHDGDTDGADLLLWQRQLGASGVQAVPEPAGILWLVLIAPFGRELCARPRRD